ncbi:MAG: DUF262 domain-containing protein [Bacteroidales bacterium]
MNRDKNIDSELFQEINIENEDLGQCLMEKPFNSTLINIETQTPVLYNIIYRLKSDPAEIDLYPDFQRKDDLWDKGKQSRLIESILINFPLPAFYFDGSDNNKWLVVDGLQRLSALRNFVINNTLSLENMEFLKNLEGKRFNELSRPLQRKIEETQIIAYIIKAGTPLEVKYNIFRRINTGGLVLEPQEIRHALNQGIPATLIAELADLKEFKEATENKIRSERMLDREFVMRFVAFYLNSPASYQPDLDSFLNVSMSQINDLSEDKIEKLKSDFKKSMIASKNIFGNWAFRKADLFPDKRKPINKALFEVWSVNIALLSDNQRQELIKNKRKLMLCFADMMKNDDKFVRSVTSGTGGKSEVVERFSKIKELINRNI